MSTSRHIAVGSLSCRRRGGVTSLESMLVESCEERISDAEDACQRSVL